MRLQMENYYFKSWVTLRSRDTVRNRKNGDREPWDGTSLN
jgi:hypothetical protein